jgi:hypothetical protein
MMTVPAGSESRVWAEAAVSAAVEKAKPIARRGRVRVRLDRIGELLSDWGRILVLFLDEKASIPLVKRHT